MLRRIPATLLVCLAILVAVFAISPAGARTPEESVDILLKPNLAGGAANEDGAGVKARHRARTKAVYPATRPLFQAPHGGPIIKVRPPLKYVPCGFGGDVCFLPKPAPGQWDLSLQTFFARTKGSIQYPRDAWWWYGYYWWDDSWKSVDFNDQLNLPAHKVLLQFTARYQFRPSWAIRYSILGDDLNGGGYPQRDFWLGDRYFYTVENLTTKWQHRYNRLGLVYDPVKTCSSTVSVFADWVHTDDSLSVTSPYCTYQCFKRSTTGDNAMVGLEFQRCSATAANGGTFSFDGKAGFLFLDDSTGWDVQGGCKYSIPMGRNRWGYVKGGYRNVTINKGTTTYVFNHTFEGGFMEFGFIF
ncbi:MAG: hypothetical protein AB1646_23520 [Thermodesulfobacteriota bacterium]